MPKLQTNYNPSWESEFEFIKPGPSIHQAYCSDCHHTFSIGNGGRSDIVKHCGIKKHRDRVGGNSSDSVVCGNSSASVVINHDENNKLQLTPQDEVVKAETIQALKVASANYTFASTTDDGDRYRWMFPDSIIAKNYHMSKTKVNYVIKHGISPYIKDLTLQDFKGTPFVFKFDETTTVQTKKQYDGYIQYWSTEQSLVTSAYCGSLFVGHCTANDLLHHFNKFGKEMKWEPDLLLQVGMDGPNVNLKFEKDLAKQIADQYGVSYIDLGSCGLHQTHNAFRKGILEFGFDVETFINDVSYFFKLSAARRDDYGLMQIVTDIETKFAMRHIISRWLSMKRPILRLLDQWNSLKEYFLKFIPKDDNCKKLIKTNLRYKRIVDFLNNPTSKADLCFIAFVSYDFEEYLTKMQTNEPMVHCMFELMSSLLYNLMMKFVVHLAITNTVDGVTKAKQGSDLASVDFTKHQKKLDAIHIGTRAKYILNDFSINSESKEVFRKKCLAFYITATKYLISKLPITSKFLKDAQFLQPEKRNYVSSVEGILRLSRKVGNTLKNHLESVFCVPKNTSVSDLCDMIGQQWQIYQLLDIPKEWYTIETDSAKKERQHHHSYWKNVERTWIDIVPKESEEKSIRIDSYWSRIFELKNSDGRKRFPQLNALVKSVLTLSHGNAGPEQGFSINKAIIASHGTSLGEDTIIALRRVKHRLLQVGGLENFKITQPLLDSIKTSRSRYEQELKENEQERASKVSKRQEVQEENELLKLEREIKDLERGIEVADKAISDGSNDLKEHLAAKQLDPEKLQSDNAKIQMGIHRKKKLADELSTMMKMKASLRKLSK